MTKMIVIENNVSGGGGGGNGSASPADITVDAATISALDTMIGLRVGGSMTYAVLAGALAGSVPANSLSAYLAVSNYVLTNELWAQQSPTASPRQTQAVANIGQAPTAAFDKDDTAKFGTKWGVGDIAINASTDPRTVYMCVSNFTNQAVWVQLYPAVTP